MAWKLMYGYIQSLVELDLNSARRWNNVYKLLGTKTWLIRRGRYDPILTLVRLGLSSTWSVFQVPRCVCPSRSQMLSYSASHLLWDWSILCLLKICPSKDHKTAHSLRRRDKNFDFIWQIINALVRYHYNNHVYTPSRSRQLLNKTE